MKRKLIALSTMIFAFFFLTSIGIGQAQDFIKGFSLKITGGYGTMAVGDYNTVGKDVEQYLDDLISEFIWIFPPSRTGEFKKINMGLDFEGELIMDLGGTFGIGIGVGYIRRSRESELGLSLAGAFSMSYFMDPTVAVIPIETSLYFFPPIASSLDIYLYGGVGYYMGKITSTFRRDYEEVGFSPYWEKSESEFKDKGLGFHGGIGLEFKLVPKVGFFIEGRARYCKLKSWEGDSTFTDSDGSTYSESGTLWYYEAQYVDTGKYYSKFILLEEGNSPGGIGVRNVREFEFNLAGVSLRTGIRIKF